ncbi:hypothetical protein NE236_10300 [Actinoallomurus purpureus]|uniref:hypothetical protein n=1 Tax=Actinoallomurus purpureus TaxID=478114 RepID=UPI0020933ED2|nr:hypothetical protein [Actinoallomurus purpureus]MCO6005376.1 hypothetical protein [Actinoallomurus purpureus]
MKLTHSWRRLTATAGMATAALLAALAPSATASVSNVEHPIASSKAVKIVGDAAAKGLHLAFEHRNRDGSVTSRWRDKHGHTFTYAGSPGVTLHVDGGKSRHGDYRTVRVSFAPIEKKNILKAAYAYTAAGRSVYNDAVNAGIPKKALKGKQPRQGGVTADYLDPPYYRSGCLFGSPSVDAASVSGCFQRKIMWQNGGDWYVADDVWGIENPGLLTPKNLYVLIWYGPGNTVVGSTPPPAVTTSDCNSQTWGGNLGYSQSGVSIGVNYSETRQVCNGGTEIVHAPDHWGVGWFNNGIYWNTMPQVFIEAVGIVHSPPSASIGNSDLELAWGPGVRDTLACHTMTTCH